MSEETREYTGGCFCQYVRYRALGRPIDVTHCHCSMCRGTCGSPFVTWVTFGRANFSFTSGMPTRFNSSRFVERSFCGRCGTTLTFEDDRLQEVDVTVGSLEQPNDWFPEKHIWTSSRLRWLNMNDGLQEYPQDSPNETKS